MCTLTYRLNNHGYEVFFNRDEQRSRSLAIPPQFSQKHNAIYPIDPDGNGTWIAVNQQGLSLALLNNYQAPLSKQRDMTSRGQLILKLLQAEGDPLVHLQAMDLSIYQPFQLCIFPKNVSIMKDDVYCLHWDGSSLVPVAMVLPVTSSSVDFSEVSQKRKQLFHQLTCGQHPTSSQLKQFHFSTESLNKYSVNMQRPDAHTVSISHISVGQDIRFEYFDNVTKQTKLIKHQTVGSSSNQF